jgi:mannose-6-phosphate isomerase-like protein (cupin superfamily)|tara:strand:- start:79 stop:468 length:390 start_codon:yes stop_codon:yes gene_type:complete
MKTRCEVNFSDERGEIRDIYYASPKEHCTIITFTPDVSRANHYHKETIQYTYVVEGNLKMATCETDDEGNHLTEVKIEEIGPGDYIEHPPYHIHAFRSITDATIIVFSNGIRGGVDYEKDVYRLKEPIL